MSAKKDLKNMKLPDAIIKTQAAAIKEMDDATK
jgi:hypothetical protein